MLSTGIPVRLKENQEAVELAASGGFECGFDFGGMVAVVVDYGDVVDSAFDVETPTDTAKIGEALPDELHRNIEVEGHSSGRTRIADIVDTRRVGKAERSQIFAFVGKAKFARKPVQLDVADQQIGLAGSAISQD